VVWTISSPSQVPHV